MRKANGVSYCRLLDPIQILDIGSSARQEAVTLRESSRIVQEHEWRQPSGTKKMKVFPSSSKGRNSNELSTKRILEPPLPPANPPKGGTRE